MRILDRIASRLGYTTLADAVPMVPKADLVALQERVMRQRNAHASGVDMSGYGSFDYEGNKALIGSKRWDTLDQMENDPHVKGALRANILPLQNATWDIVAASDSSRDEEIRDFVAANLLREETDKFGVEYWCGTSWLQRLNEKLRMLRDGFSMFGLSMRPVSGKWVFDRIQWLEPDSVDPSGWELDDEDNIVQVKRTYQTPTGKFKFRDPLLPEQLALYVWDMTGARFEGRPMVRSMYGPWVRKDFVQRKAVEWAQKVGSPVPVGHYPKGWPPEMIDNFEDFLKACRGEASAEAFGMFERSADGNDADIKYVGSETNAERGLTTIVNTENQEIAHTGATSTDMLGETQSGSRALGDSKAARDTQQVSAVSKWVSEVTAHGCGNISGLIERLVHVNFADVKAIPELVCSKIDPSEGLENFEETLKAWTAGVIPKTPEARKQIVERLGFDLPDDAYEVQEPLPVANPAGLPSAAPPPGQEQQAQPGAQAAALADIVDCRECQSHGHEHTPEDVFECPKCRAEVGLAHDDGTASAFRARIATLLEPVQEGSPRRGGRFPESPGVALRGAQRGAGSVPGGRAGHVDRTASGGA